MRPGHVSVVIGASSGIGRALAVALARRGSSVAAVGRNRERLAATLAELEAANGEGRHLPFSPPEDSDHPEDMSQLDPKAMAAEIARWAPPFWRAER